MCLSFSFKYLVELNLLQKLKNEANLNMGRFINWISRLMKYGQSSYIEFYSCYLQQCPLIDLFSYWTPGHSCRVLWNKVLYPSVWKFTANYLISFFLDLDLDVFMVLGFMCAWQSQLFWEYYFYPKNGENESNSIFWIYWKILSLFQNLFYNES